VKLLEIIRIFPDYAESYHRLGLIYEEMKEPLKAAHYFTIFAQLTKDTSVSRETWEYIGNIYYKAECWESAIKSYSRYLKINCFNIEILNKKVNCHKKIGELKKAA